MGHTCVGLGSFRAQHLSCKAPPSPQGHSDPRGITGSQSCGKPLHPQNHCTPKVIPRHQPPSEAGVRLVVPMHLPGISSFSRQNNELPLSRLVYMLWSKKHKENKTGPALPGMLAGEPAGENIEAGWISGRPLIASCPGGRFQDVSPLLSVYAMAFAALCLFWCCPLVLEQSHTSQTDAHFVQMLVHPLPQQQRWEMLRASIPTQRAF